MHLVSVDTPHGIAAVHLGLAAHPRGAVVLGHGAGGGVGAVDLVAVTRVARELGLSVALVEQPYRVAGRRAPPRAPVLDASWVAVVARLRLDELAGVPLVVGGRSSGARVACRTTTATGATAVLCLAFPLLPPRRAGKPEAASRLPELDGAGVPVLVVQGGRDPFGVPPGAPGRTVAVVAGDHSLKADLPAVEVAVREWLAELPM